MGSAVIGVHYGLLHIRSVSLLCRYHVSSSISVLSSSCAYTTCWPAFSGRTYRHYRAGLCCPWSMEDERKETQNLQTSADWLVAKKCATLMGGVLSSLRANSHPDCMASSEPTCVGREKRSPYRHVILGASHQLTLCMVFCAGLHSYYWTGKMFMGLRM